MTSSTRCSYASKSKLPQVTNSKLTLLHAVVIIASLVAMCPRRAAIKTIIITTQNSHNYTQVAVRPRRAGRSRPSSPNRFLRARRRLASLIHRRRRGEVLVGILRAGAGAGEITPRSCKITPRSCEIMPRSCEIMPRLPDEILRGGRISTDHLGGISTDHLGGISAVSRRHLGSISAVSRRYLGGISA